VFSILIYVSVIHTEVFGVVGEAESRLFDSFGRKIVEGFGVGN
jgi:hypothetical protein